MKEIKDKSFRASSRESGPLTLKRERQQLKRDLLDSVVARDLERVRELLKQGSDVNARDEEHAETPLMLAVKLDDAKVVRVLVDAGAQVDARDDTGRTALFHAKVFSESFETLLAAGAYVLARDDEGNTILMRKVSESASLAEVEELLRLGVDPSLKNSAGETALTMAESLGLLKIVERLRTSDG